VCRYEWLFCSTFFVVGMHFDTSTPPTSTHEHINTSTQEDEWIPDFIQIRITLRVLLRNLGTLPLENPSRYDFKEMDSE